MLGTHLAQMKSKTGTFLVDGKGDLRGGYAALMNHAPAKFANVALPKDLRSLATARKKIRKGQQLLTNYGPQAQKIIGPCNLSLSVDFPFFQQYAAAAERD
jgi:hypothetical protein